MEEAIIQLTNVHLLLCMQKKGNHFVLVDSVELAFTPNKAHELLTWDSAAQSGDATVRAVSASCRHTSHWDPAAQSGDATVRAVSVPCRHTSHLGYSSSEW